MSNLSDQLAVLRSNLDECEKHVKSLESGRKSASAKSRSLLMKIKNDSHLMRRDIMIHCKALPVKSRTKKEVVEAVEAVEEPVLKPKRAPRKKVTEVEAVE
jgi:hypothetical protein